MFNYKKYPGLTNREAENLHLSYGDNKLLYKQVDGDWQIFLRQLVSPLIILLMVATVLTLILGEYKDSMLISIAILINAFLGFFQERRALKSMEALKNFLVPQSKVIREGKEILINSKLVVPGDIVLLHEGDRVSADGILLEAHEIFVNESILTGESAQINKLKQDKIYMGTTVVSGAGVMKVELIGMSTEMGKIAQGVSVHEQKTPLEYRLEKLAKWITVLVLVVTGLVFLYGGLIGRGWEEMFSLAVALAVSATPEGLVIALTVVLVVGTQRILKKKALVRKLVAAETLGSVTDVCVDKTGTLTEGKMKVSKWKFVNNDIGYRIAVLANDMRDANELARVEWARSVFEKEIVDHKDFSTDIESPQVLLDSSERDDWMPFSTERRYLAVRYGKEIMIVGAPEHLLELVKMSGVDKDNVRHDLTTWAKNGLRVFGFAHKRCREVRDAEILFDKLRKKHDVVDLEWVGIMGLEDPVRDGVKEALSLAMKAGVMVRVITGDYRFTAEAVMRKIGIKLDESKILEGWEVEKMSDHELRSVVQDVVLFARTRPSQKLKIVEALMSLGRVVGMMGDGVNDAPALATAHIGMVVGDATDLAKDASDLVLIDSNFRTIIDAIEEGRIIFDNIRKIILFLMGTAFVEVVVVLGSLFMGWNSALTAAQILWINLVGAVLPFMALTIDPRIGDVLKRPPVASRLPLIDKGLLVLMIFYSFAAAMGTLFVYRMWLPLGEVDASTGAFLVVSITALLFVFSARRLHDPIWEKGAEFNYWLLFSVIIGFFITWLAVRLEILNELLGTTNIVLAEWGWAIGVSVSVWMLAEIFKGVWKKFSK